MDQQIASGFSAQGQPVAVLNSLKYFWTARTPQQVADDVDRMIRHYSARWHKQKVILVGYSQGADVMPFILNRLPASSRQSIATAALIGISDNAVFEFHIANWLTDPRGTPTLPELRKLAGLPLTCIYGSEETDSICPKLKSTAVRLVELPGGHHFNGDYKSVARAVLAGARGD
jgi:type IV secretory pathway VirJ component